MAEDRKKCCVVKITFSFLDKDIQWPLRTKQRQTVSAENAETFTICGIACVFSLGTTVDLIL